MPVRIDVSPLGFQKLGLLKDPAEEERKRREQEEANRRAAIDQVWQGVSAPRPEPITSGPFVGADNYEQQSSPVQSPEFAQAFLGDMGGSVPQLLDIYRSMPMGEGEQLRKLVDRAKLDYITKGPDSVPESVLPFIGMAPKESRLWTAPQIMANPSQWERETGGDYQKWFNEEYLPQERAQAEARRAPDKDASDKDEDRRLAIEEKERKELLRATQAQVDWIMADPSKRTRNPKTDEEELTPEARQEINRLYRVLSSYNPRPPFSEPIGPPAPAQTAPVGPAAPAAQAAPISAEQMAAELQAAGYVDADPNDPELAQDYQYWKATRGNAVNR